jgi:hypothetical protein
MVQNLCSTPAPGGCYTNKHGLIKGTRNEIFSSDLAWNGLHQKSLDEFDQIFAIFDAFHLQRSPLNCLKREVYSMEWMLS